MQVTAPSRLLSSRPSQRIVILIGFHVNLASQQTRCRPKNTTVDSCRQAAKAHGQAGAQRGRWQTWEVPCGAVGTLELLRWSRGLIPGWLQGISPPSVGSKPIAPVSVASCATVAVVSKCLPERDDRRGSLPPSMKYLRRHSKLTSLHEEQIALLKRLDVDLGATNCIDHG